MHFERRLGDDALSIGGGGQGRQALEDVQLIKGEHLCFPYKTFTAYDTFLLLRLYYGEHRSKVPVTPEYNVLQ
jgi:hypothetical protein